MPFGEGQARVVSCLAPTFWKTLKNSPANLWGKADFSPKSKGFWETLPHKALLQAQSRHQLTGKSLPPNRWSGFSFQQAEEWSQDSASIPHCRDSLGQEGSNVHALHSWRAKWWTVDRRAIKCSSLKCKILHSLPPSPTFHFALVELMSCLLVSQNPLWHKYKPLLGGKQLSGFKMPGFVLTVSSTHWESSCHSWPLET